MRSGSHVLVTGATGQVAFGVALGLAAEHRVTAIARFRDAGKRAALEAAGIKSLQDGERILFDTEPDKKGKGPKATNLVRL